MRFRIAYRGRADAYSQWLWHTANTWEPYFHAYAARSKDQLPGSRDGASRDDDALHAGESPKYRIHR
jgi:hypothetical protein